MTIRLLDLFCGAGGAAVGLHRCGFEATGVDIHPQKHYPFHFIEGNALDFPLDGFDAYWASPPCQAYSNLRYLHPGREYPKLIEPIRERLVSTGKPYVIENVEGALLNGITLCGSMFGLGIWRGYLRRHRLFETSFPMLQPRCQHKGPAVGVYGHGAGTKLGGRYHQLNKCEASEAMEIDWMTRDELSQAIPPIYAEYLGRSLMAAVLGHFLMASVVR